MPATQAWTDTGIDLSPGFQLYVTASGAIKIAGSDPGKTPDGSTVGSAPAGPCSAGAAFVAPDLQCYGMIARIGTGTPFNVLSAVSRTVTTTGQLYLGVNDDTLTDNSGAWQAAITVCQTGTLAECVGGGSAI